MVVVKGIRSMPYMPKAKSDQWNTPKWLYKFLFQLFELDNDVTPTIPNIDWLNVHWYGREYMNPPFTKLSQFVEKAYHERNNCEIIVALLPVYTDQMWFHRYVWHSAKIYFIPHRLRFNDSVKPAPFRSMVVVWENPTGLYPYRIV